MHRALFIATLGFLLTLALPAFAAEGEPGASNSATSAESESSTRTAFDADHRREIYEVNRLQRRRAFLYSLALPGIGNFYAEQPALGTAALMSMVFTGMFIAFGLRNNHPDLVAIGAATGATTYVAASVTSVLGVHRYNERMRQNLRITAAGAPSKTPSIAPSPSSFLITWELTF